MGYLNSALINLIIFILTRSITGDATLSSDDIVSKCTSKCGEVNIPYPFGIEDGCYYIDTDNPDSYQMMKLSCDDKTSPPTTILGTNIEISKINLEDGEIRLKNYISYDCYNEDLVQYPPHVSSVNMISFTVSSTKNKFIVAGCDSYAWFSGIRYGKAYHTGCMTKCDKLTDVVNGVCNGVGCCEVSIPDGVTNLTSTAESFSNHSLVSFNPCSAAYPIANDSFRFTQEDLKKGMDYYTDAPTTTVVFNWGIGTKNCSEARKGSNFLCKKNTYCSDLDPDLDGYRCNCKDGYDGNPYLPQGCQDIDECTKASVDCVAPATCHNTDGTYHCECPKGYRGDGTTNHPCISTRKAWLTPVIITAGIGGAIIISLLLAFCLYQRRGARELRKLRKNNFRQNGGLILHEKVSTMEVTKIFTSAELENATNNYNESNIIGRGGYGVVFKGLLPDNQQIAIKRSLKVDPTQVEQFINEVIVLSQINNRNVVKLIGCCLETEVPLLVYEFINNGTLYQHLHDEGRASRLTWNLRLRIATEIADVLSYLHTTISTPIIHRDIKSMNILLDKTYTAKVADFGASRLVPVDEAQLATMVLGTLGYLDPEYMQTSELTEKSDVYSFGVVLVELLTKEKALSYQRPEVERSLAMYFLLKMKEDRLFSIIDHNIAKNDEEIAQIKEVANLAKLCLMVKGDERPTMKYVAMELEGIKRMGTHNSQKSFDPTENREEYEHLLGITTSDGSNSSGKDSDSYTIPAFTITLGHGGR